MISYKIFLLTKAVKKSCSHFICCFHNSCVSGYQCILPYSARVGAGFDMRSGRLANVEVLYIIQIGRNWLVLKLENTDSQMLRSYGICCGSLGTGDRERTVCWDLRVKNCWDHARTTGDHIRTMGDYVRIT
jgi:hypothetical protein